MDKKNHSGWIDKVWFFLYNHPGREHIVQWLCWSPSHKIYNAGTETARGQQTNILAVIDAKALYELLGTVHVFFTLSHMILKVVQ